MTDNSQSKWYRRQLDEIEARFEKAVADARIIYHITGAEMVYQDALFKAAYEKEHARARLEGDLERARVNAMTDDECREYEQAKWRGASKRDDE